MTRAAVIIICPGTEGTKESLPGTEFDATGFHDFLVSDSGGAWREDEVHVFTNPRNYDLLIAQTILTNADYGLFVFSGHGFTNPKDMKVYLEIAGRHIPDDDFVRSNKQTIIIDSCRTHFILEELKRVTAETYKTGSAHIQNARKIYDDAIQAAEPGDPIYLYAASDDETASVGVDGSYYIQSLLQSAVEFSTARESESQVLDVASAHYLAKRILKRRYSKATQNPAMTGSIKRRNWFPFALRP